MQYQLHCFPKKTNFARTPQSWFIPNVSTLFFSRIFDNHFYRVYPWISLEHHCISFRKPSWLYCFQETMYNLQLLQALLLFLDRSLPLIRTPFHFFKQKHDRLLQKHCNFTVSLKQWMLRKFSNFIGLVCVDYSLLNCHITLIVFLHDALGVSEWVNAAARRIRLTGLTLIEWEIIKMWKREKWDLFNIQCR